MMAASEIFSVQNVVSIVGAAFAGAGFWNFLMKRQEKPQDDAKADEIMIQGATSVVQLQQKVMKQLQDDLDRRVKSIEELHAKQLERERLEWEQERSAFNRKISEMSQRLENLEKINKRLLKENELLHKCEHCIAEAATQ